MHQVRAGAQAVGRIDQYKLELGPQVVAKAYSRGAANTDLPEGTEIHEGDLGDP